LGLYSTNREAGPAGVTYWFRIEIIPANAGVPE
jgi:hypothetical protein